MEQRHRAVLREQVPNQARYLDRTRTPGRLVKPWNLVVPERVLHRTWEKLDDAVVRASV